MDNILHTISKTRPHLSLCAIARNDNKAYGFNLSRSDCDPYPWISNVTESSPAAESGLSVGDFVIEVNGEDILGLNIEEVSQRVWTKSDAVRLLVWKSTVDDAEIETNHKKLKQVFNRQKLCNFIQATMQLIECPVCFDVKWTPSRLYQCVNGHILCSQCRPNTDKCPMCRVPLLGKGRCLVGEKLNELITSTLNLQFSPQKVVHQKVNDVGKKTGLGSESCVFHCPWSESCNARIVGEQAVLPHLAKCHCGPLIQYTTRDDSVTITLPSHGFSIYINHMDSVYFFRRRNTGECWLSGLGPRTSLTQYCIESAEKCSSNTSRFHSVSSLADGIDRTLNQGKYFMIPIPTKELLIKFVNEV